MIGAPFLFKIAAGFYALSLGAAFLRGHGYRTVWLFLLPALAANAAAVVLRYRSAWPMLPMYLGSTALPLCLGLLAAFAGKKRGTEPVRRTVLGLAAATALAAVLFPKDYYLPFIKSQTLLAHLFFWFSTAGKGCFLVASAWAAVGLFFRDRSGEESGGPGLNRSLYWTIWGFSFWTLSMFAGELWSYLGWGTPVVWDDPAITTTMATWFFYIGLLHLHLTGSWIARGRGAYTTAGGLVVLGLNCVPDLGPFRWPF